MIKNKYSKIKLIIYDFDGVMTDNTFILDKYGNESVKLNRSDGFAISELKKLNIKQIILSTEKNNIVKIRARKLKINCYNDIKNKEIFLKEYSVRKNIKFGEICYVGNDINDYDAMKNCKYKFCPSDAVTKIKKISDFILPSKGGDGVIRDFYEKLMV